MVDQPPPHVAKELEAGVLWKALEKEHARETLLSIIAHPMVFWIRDHRMIWLVLSRMGAGGLTEAVEVARSMAFADATDWIATYANAERTRSIHELGRSDHDHLRRLQKTEWRDGVSSVLDELGGYVGLADINAYAAPVANLSESCAYLVRLYQIRYTQRSLSSLAEDLSRPDASLEATQEALLSLSTATPEDADDCVTSIGAFAAATVDDEAEPPDFGRWPLQKLNELSPLKRNGVYVVAAFPGRGKTTFALETATQTCKDRGYAPGTVAMVSLEMDRRELAVKLMARAAGCSTRDVERRTWSAEQREASRVAMERLGDSLVLNDLSSVTAKSISRWARKHRRQYPAFHTLIVDYLQLMGGKQDREYDRLSDITRHLSMLRKELNIAIVLLSQLNRESDKGEKARKPRLSDLRGSGSIEQDATAVMFLHSYDDPSVPGDWNGAVLVPKNRNGPTGEVPFVFRRSIGRFDQGAAASGSDPWGVSRRYAEEPNPLEDLFGS